MWLQERNGIRSATWQTVTDWGKGDRECVSGRHRQKREVDGQEENKGSCLAKAVKNVTQHP